MRCTCGERVTAIPTAPKIRGNLDYIYSYYLSSLTSGKIKDAFSVSSFTGQLKWMITIYLSSWFRAENKKVTR